MNKPIIILGIESSCDDTSAAVLVNKKIKSNLVANQSIHAEYGGVVPELASRAHQQNIVPVVYSALQQAEINLEEINAIAFTRGPGLLGSLLVGSSFAKGISLALGKPLLEVNHMRAHILAHFIDDNASTPKLPFLCLTVSGGHTQIVLVKSQNDMEVLGETLDDAAGEAFDKTAKMLGLPYPGGPLIDKYAKEGNPLSFSFNAGNVKGYDFSYSGLKTGVLYFLQKQKAANEHFISENLNDICASVQHTIVTNLIKKLKKASKELGIKEVAIAGGVSANSYLRAKLKQEEENGWKVHIPNFEYCTDNAAMIAIAGHFLYKEKMWGSLANAPLSRMRL